mgnify:FL=1
MKYIIPSFKRFEKLKSQTLAFLERHDIRKTDIYIFVRGDDPQLHDYLSLEENIVVLDVHGIGKTHNGITHYFDEGEHLVEIDDDLIDIYNQEREVLETPFNIVAECIFQKLDSLKLSYCGTYSVVNPMFMSSCKEFTTDLRYCLGCLRFRINRKEILVDTDYSEDFENCILHYLRDGGLLKANWIACKTNNYSDGGCDGDGRNHAREYEAKKYLNDCYPDLCTLFQRKNKRWDLRLKDKRVKPDITVMVVNAYPSRTPKYDRHKYKMFPAVWWEDLPEATLEKYQFRYNCNIELQKKIASCSESHLNLLKHIVEKKLDKIIILEDDAIIEDWSEIDKLKNCKEFCYIGGQLNSLKVSEYGKLDTASVRNNLSNDNFNTIDTEKYRITHNLGYYIPSYKIAEEILQNLPKSKKHRAIDVEFFNLQQKKMLCKFYYPAIATLHLPDAKHGFTYGDKTSYNLKDNQKYY